jgi:hemoglobin
MRSLVLLVCLLLGACAGQPPKDDSLYQQLGGEPGVTRIVEGMLLRIADDRRIVEHFQDIDIQRLRVRLYDDHGRILNFNNSNYSFVLLFKMVYDL